MRRTAGLETSSVSPRRGIIVVFDRKPTRHRRPHTRARRPRRARPFGTLPDGAGAGSFTASPADSKDIAMIDLYALTSPNVQKVYVVLEETKLPYKEHFVDV